MSGWLAALDGLYFAFWIFVWKNILVDAGYNSFTLHPYGLVDSGYETKTYHINIEKLQSGSGILMVVHPECVCYNTST